MNKSEYPNLWKRGKIQQRVRIRANHRCEQCGMEFRPGTNLAVSELNRRGRPIVGTVHHIDENKANCSMRNLVYLCQRCHMQIHAAYWYPGKPLIPKWRNQPPKWVEERGVPFRYNQNVFNAPHLCDKELL